MQWAMFILKRLNPETVDHDLWNALFDLETEVSFYEPKSPPFGSQTNGQP